jgi:hypothetical protein
LPIRPCIADGLAIHPTIEKPTGFAANCPGAVLQLTVYEKARKADHSQAAACSAGMVASIVAFRSAKAARLSRSERRLLTAGERLQVPVCLPPFAGEILQIAISFRANCTFLSPGHEGSPRRNWLTSRKFAKASIRGAHFAWRLANP